MDKEPTRQVRWDGATSKMPADLLDRAMVWGLKQKPPLRKKTEVLVALIELGLKRT